MDREKRNIVQKQLKTRWKLSWGNNYFKLLGINFHVDLDKMIDLN